MVGRTDARRARACVAAWLALGVAACGAPATSSAPEPRPRVADPVPVHEVAADGAGDVAPAPPPSPDAPAIPPGAPAERLATDPAITGAYGAEAYALVGSTDGARLCTAPGSGRGEWRCYVWPAEYPIAPLARVAERSTPVAPDDSGVGALRGTVRIAAPSGEIREFILGAPLGESDTLQVRAGAVCMGIAARAYPPAFVARPDRAIEQRCTRRVREESHAMPRDPSVEEALAGLEGARFLVQDLGGSRLVFTGPAPASSEARVCLAGGGAVACRAIDAVGAEPVPDAPRDPRGFAFLLTEATPSSWQRRTELVALRRGGADLVGGALLLAERTDVSRWDDAAGDALREVSVEWYPFRFVDAACVELGRSTVWQSTSRGARSRPRITTRRVAAGGADAYEPREGLYRLGDQGFERGACP